MLTRLRPYLHIVILCLIWYIISSLGSQVTKQILTVSALPLFLGEFQFIYTALLAAASCCLAYSYPYFYDMFPAGTFPEYSCKQITTRRGASVITRPSAHIVQTVLPLGVFQFVGKYFGHTATSLVPVSTVASIKTVSPVFILLIQKILRIETLRFDIILCFSLSCLVSGVWIIVAEDSKHYESKGKSSNYSSWGVLCAIISMFIFVGQNIYGKKVFTFKSKVTKLKNEPEREDSPLPIYSELKPRGEEIGKIKYDKMTLMIYISSVGFLLSFGWFMTLEFPIVWGYLMRGKPSPLIQVFPWKLYLLNGTLHFLQAMIAYHLLGEVSTLTYSIANLMKRIAIISVSWLFVGRPITFFQVFGLLMNTLGLFLYEKCSSDRKKTKLRPD
ncbi:uncharacterized protein KNAG_0C02210 [Huiozyma naganishii CBS 8797]|uniref:Sugar phosphate transporter domain-containing protein n=1 Tax=Huiozyma naganishii (strain ATCC MYA-139 / BCRC 22969 / CBS 8797 / KCTC 17520 / NBRC 10181 / NCYC 3082 / Yp74L-3) TaxID=1071383 RepID=J7RWF2_HUIN7|nr:hypothetical protein KNAG_0C02210 [Kazachstania naganishii CBS 8797]CCK69332.1 hypothetical protein KNAG_0C02210 [Kazachstania naganishii CBS 8797]